MTQHKANEAEILFPEMSVVINDEPVVVKEFSFIQGMKVNAMAKPFIKGLSVFFSDGEDVDFSAMSVVFDSHVSTLIELMAISTGKPVEWFETLSDTDGQSLLMAFWSVNRNFFINRLLLMKMQKQQTEKTE